MDGLFGIGLNRDLSPAWIECLEAINQSGRPILSVDCPSGLNADTGERWGAALRAAVTVTLGAPKRGLLAATAWPWVGRLEVAPEIGLVPWTAQAAGTAEAIEQWTLPEDFVGWPPRRPVAGHKGTFGHLAIVAGSLGFHGAAVLAARGAFRARPGLVTVFPQAAVYGPVAAQLDAAMVQPWQAGRPLPESVTALVVGPGLAAPDLPEAFKAEVVRWWQEWPHPVVADASALDWLPEGPTFPGAIRVLTPHPGEAARRLQASVSQVQSDRGAALRELSRRFGHAWVLLKGHQTLVGRQTGPVFVNSSGNPDLAQGGSGDLLAGYVGGWLAQTALHDDPLTALRFAVWQHGATADQLSAESPAWTVQDLAARLGRAPSE